MTQSQKRHTESLAPLFEKQDAQKKLLVLKSSTDVGVIRNGGRNGAKYAPQSILSHFKKLNQNAETAGLSFIETETGSEEEELQDFENAQFKQTERIGQALASHPGASIFHLGGGHDHIYPLLKALSGKHNKVVVINIDAHADTRTDPEVHSGTPFRQFSREFEGQFHLFQIGLQSFANSLSTLTPLPKGQMALLWRSEMEDQKLLDIFFKAIEENVDKDTLVIFSLDADALDGSEVPGVSAVNPWGLKLSELFDLWGRYRGLRTSHPPALGIYELNPVFDTISMMSSRRIAAFMYQAMRG